MAQRLAGFELMAIGQHFSRSGERRRIDEMTGLFMRLDEGFDFLAQRFISRASPDKKDRTIAGLARERGVKEFLHLVPVFGNHDPLSLQRSSKACAQKSHAIPLLTIL